MPRIQSYRGGAPAADDAPPLGQATTSVLSRDLSYEQILADQGVERDPQTGRLFRWVGIGPVEHARDGTPRQRQVKHFVALTAEAAQNNSKPGECWDFYVVGARCRIAPTPCDRPITGWAHRGRKLSNEHHHITDMPSDQMWAEVPPAADEETADPVAAGV
jgi:hypothetical protein